MAGGMVLLTTGIHPVFAAPHRVGVGKSIDPYEATLRAVAASGNWPSTQIFGKTVAIKPNLVAPSAANGGVTTDPEVARALVDLALEAEAAEVIIIEDGFEGANFSACGYDSFDSYDPRVRLVDLHDEPVVLGSVSGALAYSRLYIAELLLSDNLVFISAAKLKTHVLTHATLSMKNLIGIAPSEQYVPPAQQSCWSLHNRGISQVIVDLNLLRPIDYAVVDGVWAMEGDGPLFGDPVRMDMVVAGKNALAVDRVCLAAMEIPQGGVRHLTYAARMGMGPVNLDNVETVGDPFTTRPFKWPSGLPPILEYPRFIPNKFIPNAGQEVKIVYKIYIFTCLRRVNIVRTSETSIEVTHIRILREWEFQPPGWETLTWDGRDDNGAIVPPGIYCVNLEAKYIGDGSHNVHASGWVTVV